MAENSVTTTFFADEKSAIAAIAKLEKKYEDLEQKIKHMHKGHNEGAHEAIEKIGELGKSVAGMVLGFASVEGAIEKVFEATLEWRKECDAAALSIDKANRSFAIRAGTFGPQGQETLEKVRAGADQAAISHQDAEILYGDFKRHGFGAEALDDRFADVAGGFAVNRSATGVDSAALAEAVAKSMDRSAPKTGEAVAKGIRDIFSMTRGTQMTAGDVGALGETLETARGGRRAEVHAAALGRMGLKFEDVDLIGEDFATAMTRIKTGLEKVKPEERMAVLKELTGDAGMARRVMTGIDAMHGNTEIFDEAIGVQTGGLAAGKQRAANRLHEMAAAEGGDFDVQLDAADLLSREKGAWGWMNSMRRGTARSLRGAGASDEFAIESAFGSAGESSGVMSDPEAFMKEVKEQTRILKEGLDVQKKVAEEAEKGNEKRDKPRRGNGAED